jgi:predicted metal-dependent hydrolase
MKSLRLRVSPSGEVRVSAPFSVSNREVFTFVEDRLGWIARQREELTAHQPEPALEFVEGELHWVWGEQVALELEVGIPTVSQKVDRLLVISRIGSTAESRERQLSAWYRKQLSQHIPPLIAAWETTVGVSLSEWRVREMRTRWGSCNIGARRIWLSLSLAKYRPELLEYVVVHELVHLKERLHGERFQELMSESLPSWKELKAELNRLPLR